MLTSHGPAVDRRAAAPTAAPLAGRATEAGTARFARRHVARRGDGFYRAFAGDLCASAIGLGSYLGECDDAEDARYTRAARLALALGVNVLDTAINYRCQRSERALGRAIAGAIADGETRRDELIVCTKGGYVALDGAPPATREAYDAYLEREFYAPGVMRPEDLVAGGHSLAPSFLRHQIAASRANLGVDTIDLYYLHNPEQQLDTLPREAVLDAVRAAFAELEARADAGEIAGYGVATWYALRAAPGAKIHLSLEELVGAARDVAGDAHRLRAVQLPVNLGMSEAVRAATQPLAGRDVPVLEAATALGVAAVASAPLMQGQLARGLPLAIRDAFPALDTDAQRAIAFVAGLPGVLTALVGMRREEHVRENVAMFDAGRSGAGDGLIS